MKRQKQYNTEGSVATEKKKNTKQQKRRTKKAQITKKTEQSLPRTLS